MVVVVCVFLQHALPLPFFLLFAQDIYRHVELFNRSGNCSKKEKNEW